MSRGFLLEDAIRFVVLARSLLFLLANLFCHADGNICAGRHGANRHSGGFLFSALYAMNGNKALEVEIITYAPTAYCHCSVRDNARRYPAVIINGRHKFIGDRELSRAAHQISSLLGEEAVA